MKKDEKEMAASVWSRMVELGVKPVKGNFDAEHLKEIQRKIFQALPEIVRNILMGQPRPSG